MTTERMAGAEIRDTDILVSAKSTCAQSTWNHPHVEEKEGDSST